MAPDLHTLTDVRGVRYAALLDAITDCP